MSGTLDRKDPHHQHMLSFAVLQIVPYRRLERLANMPSLGRLATRKIDISTMRVANLWGDARSILVKIAALFQRAGRAVKGAALWLYHAPANVWHTIAHAIGAVGTAIRWTATTTMFLAKTFLLGLVGCLVLFAAYKLGRVSYMAYESHRAARRLQEEHLRRMAELEARAQVQREEELRRRADEIRKLEEARRRAVAEEQFRREAEQARSRERQQQKLRDEALRKLRQQEDLRLYNRWRTDCDEVFKAGHGTLPEPPSWPCHEMKCREERRLKACCHNLERVFSSNGAFRDTLQAERIRWHPNNAIFYRLAKGSVEMATEIFQVIESLRK